MKYESLIAWLAAAVTGLGALTLSRTVRRLPPQSSSEETFVYGITRALYR